MHKSMKGTYMHQGYANPNLDSDSSLDSRLDLGSDSYLIKSGSTASDISRLRRLVLEKQTMTYHQSHRVTIEYRRVHTDKRSD